MEAKAVAKYVRIAPRKVRVVMDLIRGKNVADAFAILKFTPKVGAEVIEKVLKSAVANASATFLPRIRFITTRTLRGAMRTYFATALASMKASPFPDYFRSVFLSEPAWPL